MHILLSTSLQLASILKLILLLGGALSLSLLIYEYVIRQLKWIKPLFGVNVSSADRFPYGCRGNAASLNTLSRDAKHRCR